MATIPSIAMIPSGVKASKLYSVLPTNGTGDFTTTRASVATRVNESGLIEEVASNVPRLDYSDGSCPSLLLEPTATNLIPYSEDFSNVAWQKADCSITSNSAISPDGTLNASKYTSNGLNPYLQEFVSSTSITNSLSIWVKGVGSTIGKVCKIYAVRDSYAEAINQTFNLTSEWQRIEATLTFSVAPTSTVGFRLDAPDNAVIGDEVLVYGAQVEQNSYSTSYIKTIGTAQTRVADGVNKTGLSSLIGQTEGTFFLNIKTPQGLGTKRISLSDATSANRVLIQINDANLITVFFISGSATVFESNYFALPFLEDYNKIGIKYKSNDFNLFINGVSLDSDLITALPPFTVPLSRLGIDGSNVSDLPFYGKIKEIQTFKTALTDAELTSLTTI